MMKEKDFLLKEQGIFDDNEREQFVINWAANAVSAAACGMKFNSKEKESERASNSLENNSKNGSSGSGIDGNLQQLDDESDIYAACEHPQTLRLLQLLCGVTAVLNSNSNKSLLSKGKKNVSRLLHFEDTLAASDDEQQVHSILCGSFSLPTFPSALLPPRLHFDHHIYLFLSRPNTLSSLVIITYQYRLYFLHSSLFIFSLNLISSSALLFFTFSSSFFYFISFSNFLPQMKSLLMTLSPRHCERMFYPELVPLKTHATSTTNTTYVH